MKKYTTYILISVVLVGQLVLLASEIFGQKTKIVAEKDTKFDDCIKLILTADSDVLSKEIPMNLIVEIRNNCHEKVELDYKPSYLLRKVVASNTRPIFGDMRLGIHFEKEDELYRKTIYKINPSEKLEFSTDTSKIKWNDYLSSQELFLDTFDDLEIGQYYFQAKIDLLLPDKGKSKTQKIYSNALKVIYRG